MKLEDRIAALEASQPARPWISGPVHLVVRDGHASGCLYLPDDRVPQGMAGYEECLRSWVSCPDRETCEDSLDGFCRADGGVA